MSLASAWLRRISVAALAPTLAVGCTTPLSTSPDVSAPSEPVEAAVPVETWEDAVAAVAQEHVAELAQTPFGTGAAVSVRRGSYERTFVAGTGKKNGYPIEATTTFNVASVSKLGTAAKVIDLASSGKLDLNDPLSKHLPGVQLAPKNAKGLDAPAKKAPKPQTVDVTIQQLLCHQAGLPHQPAGLPSLSEDDWVSPEFFERVTTEWKIPLIDDPGEYHYSNLGYALLAAVVERVDGCTFSGCMRDYLEREGLRHSTYWPGELTTLDGNPSPPAYGGYHKNEQLVFHPPGWYQSRYALPFTGLWTTAPDLTAFGMRLAKAAQSAQDPLHDMTQWPSATGHGLGPVHRQRHGVQTLEHDGSGPGFMAWLIVIPSRQLSIAAMANGGDESDEQGRVFMEHVESIVDAALTHPQG